MTSPQKLTRLYTIIHTRFVCSNCRFFFQLDTQGLCALNGTSGQAVVTGVNQNPFPPVHAFLFIAHRVQHSCCPQRSCASQTSVRHTDRTQSRAKKKTPPKPNALNKTKNEKERRTQTKTETNNKRGACVYNPTPLRFFVIDKYRAAGSCLPFTKKVTEYANS